jgi:hypothetical protein
MTDNDEVRTLEAERDKWKRLYKRRDTDYVRMIESKNDKLCELEAELNQCLTAHAMLNDKVCALENTKLDDSNDRCIAEHWNKMND